MISADFTGIMKYLEFAVFQNKADGNLDIGIILLKIIHFNGTAAGDNADGVENRGFACVVLANENQGVFDIGDLQVADGLVILDSELFEAQGGQSFLKNMFNIRIP